MTSNTTPPLLSLLKRYPLSGWLSEWIALIPLIVHLADSKGDHNLIGELALSGRLGLSLFPKLGHLQGISHLLNGTPDFLDRASCKSDLSATIWHVGWGNSFPCANGAARDLLTRYALQGVQHVIDLEPKLSPAPNTQTSVNDSDPIGVADGTRMSPLGECSVHQDHFKRYQLLHVFEINKGRRPVVSRLRHVWSSAWHVIPIPLLIACAGTFIFLGAYGTAMTIVICIVTQLACRLVPVERPAGYLQNTEKDDFACYLCAVHPNAFTWYLYVGDRASIDWLLNKTMIAVRTGDAWYWAWLFGLAHYLQLLSMTFVAGNKGYDGVCLLCLLAINTLFKFIWGYPSHWAALRWLSNSWLTIQAHSFKLTGRVPMLGAIQLLSANRSSCQCDPAHADVAWMDSINSPSSRRAVWATELSKIAGQAIAEESLAKQRSSLSETDRRWVDDNVRWSKEAYQCVSAELKNSRAWFHNAR